jgi:hypothetical protein
VCERDKESQSERETEGGKAREEERDIERQSGVGIQTLPGLIRVGMVWQGWRW